MGEAAPVVYLLHGEDEFAIAEFISEMEARLGDPATAAMNITRLDGRSYNLDELLSVASAMPFLAARRLVVLANPLARLNSPSARQKFIEQLGKIPPSTALALVEYSTLTDEKQRRKGKLHWLEKWALQAGDRVYIKAFPRAKGPALARWIQERARRAGGQFTPQAAELLASLSGGDPRLADQEIHKLLSYVNYCRPVEIDDVENLSPDAAEGNIFALVDALGAGDGRGTMSMLQRLLEKQDPFSIFGMIVRQFRLLLLAREILDNGGNSGEIARQLKTPAFVADKLIAQARRFTLPDLEMIYHRLLDLDESVKTSQMPHALALEAFVAAFTSSQPLR
ncbi:MAG: DNA polymerase III subunit delta [Anaerolineales bacterium]|nr:DNA polymerase III subunit delta [Anaerolineales bacterium]